MAEIILLTPEQVAERENPKGRGRVGRQRSPERTRIIEAYKAALQEAHPGYGADVRLEAGDDKRTVRQNLKAAAEELHLALDFRPIRDPNRIHLRVMTPEERAARPKRGVAGRANLHQSSRWRTALPKHQRRRRNSAGDARARPRSKRRQRRGHGARTQPMEELREVLQELSSQLSEASELARQAGYLARRLGLPDVDHQIEDELLPWLVTLADDSRTATHPGSVGQLLALLEEDS